MTGSPRSQVSQTSRRDDLQRERDEAESWRQRLDGVSYDLFGSFFADNKGKFVGLQRTLDEAHYGVSVDLYLSKATLLTIVTTIIGFFLGFGFNMVLSAANAIPAELFLVYAFVLSMGTAVLSAVTTISGIVLWPRLKASGRERAIEKTLPHAVTFMYALSRGGMNFIEVLEKLADADETYGEVAREIQPIIKDLEYFSSDLPRALHDSGRRTPSDKYEQFMDDLVGILDTGADLTTFLEDKAEQFHEDAEREQKSFIDFLELLGEVYVTAFVAGPLFLIIITVVMSMLGGTSIMQLYGIVYFLLPIMNFGFFILIDTISPDEGGMSSTLSTGDTSLSVEELEEMFEEDGGEDERLKQMVDAKKKRERNELFREPISYTLRNPEYTLLVSVPVTILYVAVALATGLVSPTLAGMEAEPVHTTFFLGIFPLLTLVIPFSLFHEIHQYREARLVGRLPDALKQLASNNAVGMTLEESLGASAETTGGRLGKELEKVRNDIEWKHDINSAMVSFANRVKSHMLARTVKLITEANQSTGDIADVLEVAAQDVMTRQRLKKQRKDALRMYTAVILISFGVYLFVIGILDAAFLSQLSKISSSSSNTTAQAGSQPAVSGGSGGMSMNMSNLPLDKFRMVFFHSTVVQALASGMLAGTLGSGDPRSGLKYSAILIMISTVSFWALGTFT